MAQSYSLKRHEKEKYKISLKAYFFICRSPKLIFLSWTKWTFLRQVKIDPVEESSVVAAFFVSRTRRPPRANDPPPRLNLSYQTGPWWSFVSKS